jgi:ERF superfamily
MTAGTATLAEALAAFQANLPAVVKAATAKVKGQTKDGRPFEYEYGYADLADVSAVVLPLLGSLGLSFSAKPTLNADGKFVLAYRLLHVSGDSDEGEYPLPSGGTAQELGSAITYARRYALCSVVGVAPDKDDDGAAANPRRGGGIRTSTATEPDPWESAVPATAVRPAKPAPARKATPVADGETLMMSDLSRRRMFALFNDLGYGGDENQQARRAIATKVLRRPVESISELTEVEAHHVITALNERKLKGASA